MEHEEKVNLINKVLEPLEKQLTAELKQVLLKVYDCGRRDAFTEMEGIAKAINSLTRAEER